MNTVHISAKDQRERERERESITPFQPHRADAGAREKYSTAGFQVSDASFRALFSSGPGYFALCTVRKGGKGEWAPPNSKLPPQLSPARSTRSTPTPGSATPTHPPPLRPTAATPRRPRPPPCRPGRWLHASAVRAGPGAMPDTSGQLTGRLRAVLDEASQLVSLLDAAQQDRQVSAHRERFGAAVGETDAPGY